MDAVYKIEPYIDGAHGELYVEGEFTYEHPIDGTENDTAQIGPRVSVTGRLVWQDGDQELTFESYASGHLWSIDEGAALLLEAIAMTPDSGIGADFWADWTPEQIAWRDKYAEDARSMASCEGEDDEGANNPCGKEHPDGCYGQSLKHLRKES